MTRDELIARKAQPANVPCNGCTACCKKDVVVLGEEESARFPWHYEGDRRVMDRKENGECINLGPTGCKVHDNPPDICKRFDCRVLFLLTDKTKRRIRIVQNSSMQAVYEAGKKRLDTLK